MTRQEAALYAFNMLQATMVEYDTTSTIVVGDITINTASSRKDVENNASSEGIKDDDKMQFAEMYFNRLTLTTDTTDDFGRPANTWRYRGSEVGTYAKTADATYTADVRLGQIYSDLGMSDSDDRAEVYVDGIEADDAAKVSRGNDLKVSELDFDGTNDCAVGNGTLVEAFLDEDTNDVTIVAINTYVAEVNRVVAATSSKDAYITLSATSAAPMPTQWQANDEFETEGFDNDQIVLFTYSNSEEKIESVVAAESVEGALNRKVATKSLTLGDTAYDYSEMYGVDGGETTGLNVGSEYTAYTDTYGYVIYVEESEYNIADYAFLRALDSSAGSSSAFGSDRASVLTYDGKIQTLATSEDYTDDATFSAYSTTPLTIGANNSKIVVTRQTSSGDYRLRAVDTKNYAAAAAAGSFEMMNGVARIDLTATGVANGGTLGTDYIYADSRTVFVVGTYTGTHNSPVGLTYRSYTGISNAPTIRDDGSTAGDPLNMSYYCRSGNVATIVFLYVNTNDYNVTSGNSEVIYLALESASGRVEDIDNDYYELNAVVDGEIVEGLKVSATEFATLTQFNSGVFASAFTNATYDDDVITGLTAVGNTVQGVNKLSNENLVLGWTGVSGSGSTYVVADDVEVYFIDDDGDITEGTINNVRRSTDDIVTYVIDSNSQISHLFIQQYFENNDQPAGGNNNYNITGITYSGTTLTVNIAAALSSNVTIPVSIYEINGGNQVLLYTVNVTVTAGNTTGTASIGTLNAGYTHLAVSGSFTAGI